MPLAKASPHPSSCQSLFCPKCGDQPRHPMHRDEIAAKLGRRVADLRDLGVDRDRPVIEAPTKNPQLPGLARRRTSA